MALFDLDNNRKQGVPRARRKQWEVWRDNLSDADYAAIEAQINDYCDSHSPIVSSYIPKAIWADEPCQPLLDACNQNAEHAGFFFGLIVWKTIADRRRDEWYFKPAADDNDILGTTYWRTTQRG